MADYTDAAKPCRGNGAGDAYEVGAPCMLNFKVTVDATKHAFGDNLVLFDYSMVTNLYLESVFVKSDHALTGAGMQVQVWLDGDGSYGSAVQPNTQFNRILTPNQAYVPGAPDFGQDFVALQLVDPGAGEVESCVLEVSCLVYPLGSDKAPYTTFTN